MYMYKSKAAPQAIMGDHMRSVLGFTIPVPVRDQPKDLSRVCSIREKEAERTIQVFFERYPVPVNNNHYLTRNEIDMIMILVRESPNLAPETYPERKRLPIYMLAAYGAPLEQVKDICDNIYPDIFCLLSLELEAICSTGRAELDVIDFLIRRYQSSLKGGNRDVYSYVKSKMVPIHEMHLVDANAYNHQLFLYDLIGFMVQANLVGLDKGLLHLVVTSCPEDIIRSIVRDLLGNIMNITWSISWDEAVALSPVYSQLEEVVYFPNTWIDALPALFPRSCLLSGLSKSATRLRKLHIKISLELLVPNSTPVVALHQILENNRLEDLSLIFTRSRRDADLAESEAIKCILPPLCFQSALTSLALYLPATIQRIDMTEETVTLLQRLRLLKNLVVNGHFVVDIARICDTLYDNHSLELADLCGVTTSAMQHKKHPYESVFQLLKTQNATLKHLRVPVTLESHSSNDNNQEAREKARRLEDRIKYFLTLNHMGRKLARDPNTNRAEIIALITREENTFVLSQHLDYLYDILLENTSVWVPAR